MALRSFPLKRRVEGMAVASGGKRSPKPYAAPAAAPVYGGGTLIPHPIRMGGQQRGAIFQTAPADGVPTQPKSPCRGP